MAIGHRGSNKLGMALAVAAAMSVGISPALPSRPTPQMRTQQLRFGRPKFNKYGKPHQGGKECERRRRQIAKGMIFASNSVE